MIDFVSCECSFHLYFQEKINFLLFFRLREELIQTNEQLREYRDLINLINENILPNTDCFDDDSKPIEKNFCLNDKSVFLYSKPSEEIQ